MSAIDQDTRLQGENVLLDEQAIHKLEQDEGNMVLQYEYDEVERVLPMTEVEALVRAVVTHADRRTMEVDAFRQKIQADDSAMATFARTHPTIFRKVTDRRTPPRELETLCGMMSIRAKQERGELSDAQVAGGLEHYLRQQIKTTPNDPGERGQDTPGAAAAATAPPS